MCVFGRGSVGLQIAYAIVGARSSSGYSALSNIWIDPSLFHRVRDILGIPVSRCNQGYGSILDLTDVPHDAEIVIVLSRHLASSDLETLLFLVASNHSVTRLMVSTSALGPRVLALLNEAMDPNTDRLWKASGLFNSDRRHVFEIFSRRPTHLAPLSEQTRTLSFPTDLAVSAIMIGELRRTLAFNGTCEETSEDMDLMTYVHIGKSLDSDGFSDVRCMSAGGFGHVVTYTKRNQEGVLKLSANPYPSNRSIQIARKDSILREAEIYGYAPRQLKDKISVPQFPFGSNQCSTALIYAGENTLVTALAMERCVQDGANHFRVNRAIWHQNKEITDASRDALKEMTKVIHVLHNKQLTHNDLKPGNWLLTNQNEWRLTDFGNGRILEYGCKRVYKQADPTAQATQTMYSCRP